MKTIQTKQNNFQNFQNFYASRFVAVLILAVTVEMFFIVALVFGGAR